MWGKVYKINGLAVISIILFVLACVLTYLNDFVYWQITDIYLYTDMLLLIWCHCKTYLTSENNLNVLFKDVVYSSSIHVAKPFPMLLWAVSYHLIVFCTRRHRSVLIPVRKTCRLCKVSFKILCARANTTGREHYR